MRKFLDKLAPKFEKGGPLEKFYPLYEGADTILYSPGLRTRTASHVRDGIDLKRMMLTVIVALLPCVAFAVYNTGYQSNLAIALAHKRMLCGQRHVGCHSLLVRLNH